MFPNLHLIHSKSTSIERLLGLNLKNLKELNVDLFQQNQYLFREVLQKFFQIRHLTLHLNTAKQNSILIAFKESAVLQNLIELKYNAISARNGNQFLDSLKQLSNKFPKLKSIQIGFVSVKDLRQHLCPLKAFPELKRLDLVLAFLKPQNKCEFSFQAFRELSNITHLTLEFKVNQLNEKILTNIDIYLPKLQYLSIKCRIFTDEKGMTQMAVFLSRLSSLRTIVLRLNLGSDTQLMTTKIVEKCKKIRNIDISDK